MLAEFLSRRMTLVWLGYFLFAEISSLAPSQLSACILISEEAQAENYSGNYPCASMHEAIFRFVRFIWSEAGHDNVVAFGTILIAIFTYVLYRSTEKLWLAGEGQIAVALKAANAADISAKAAKESAEAAVAAERARFFIIIEEHNIDELMQIIGRFPNSPTMPLSFEPRIIYSFKNYGKTPGVILEVSHGMRVCEGPPDPTYTVSKHLFIENMIAAGGATEPQTFDGPVKFETLADGLPLLSSQKHFWFFGRFDYRDVFGNPQVHRFLMRYVKIGKEWGFQPFDYKHYNQST